MTASGSSIIADSRGCTGVSVKPTGTPSESSSRFAGSTVTRRVLRPCLARWIAMAAEQVVLPTPPLPTTMTRFLPRRPCTAAATAISGMKATPPGTRGASDRAGSVGFWRGEARTGQGFCSNPRSPEASSVALSGASGWAPVAADQREVWTAIADSFDRTRQAPWPHVAAFLRDHPPGSLVLDLMAGNGRHAKVAAQAGHRVVAVDWSLPLLRRALGAGCDRVLADATRLPVRTGSVDACV